MTPQEQLVAQAVPATAAAAVNSSLPWQSAMPCLSSSELKSMSGNGMHMHVVGLVATYAIAHSVKQQKGRPFKPDGYCRAPSIRFEMEAGE